MEQKNVQALFQLQDSFVKEFNIIILKRFESKENLNIIGKLGFKINRIDEVRDRFIGQIELINDLSIKLKEEEYAKIHICMAGIFTGLKNENYDRVRFEEMLKLNGSTTLSHFIRAYIYSVTGLSGMPQINTPMINFIEFFKKAEIEKEEKDKQN